MTMLKIAKTHGRYIAWNINDWAVFTLSNIEDKNL